MDDLQVGVPTRHQDLATSGDARETVFARFVELRLADHYRIAAVILGDPVEAQDATHDAMAQAWRGWSNLRDVERLDAWVGRILVNECRDRIGDGADDR